MSIISVASYGREGESVLRVKHPPPPTHASVLWMTVLTWCCFGRTIVFLDTCSFPPCLSNFLLVFSGRGWGVLTSTGQLGIGQTKIKGNQGNIFQPWTSWKNWMMMVFFSFLPVMLFLRRVQYEDGGVPFVKCFLGKKINKKKYMKNSSLLW